LPLKRQGYLPCGDATIAVKKKILKTDTDKEEWQANSLAAAILMPKFAFLYCAHQEIRRQYGTLSSPINDSDDPERYRTTIENIAGVFNVSFQATEIRLDQYDLII
jgi:Zn-dependent peptidase ImmA (M78 family)